jgi:hypothetical protein
MGFLDSIGTLLGGFNDVKQIDTDGFDFREKRRQEEIRRQQQQQEWEQQNTQFGNQQEDRAVNQVADVLAGSEGAEPDVNPLLAGIEQSKRAFMLDRARGVSKERKSSLARQKAESDFYLRSMTEGGQDKRLDKRLDVVKSEGDANRGSREGVAGADREVDWARIAAMMARGGQGGTARKPYWNVKEKRTDFLTNEEVGSVPQGTYTDVVTGRQAANSGDEGMNTIVQNLDDSLANYEQSQKGLGMLVPSSMNVAWDRYRSSLQSAGQIFGRQFLKDTRVSEQDREAYAKTIGQPDRWLTVLDPKEARRRLDLIKKMAQKYPEVAGGGQGGEPTGGRGGGVAQPRSKAEMDALPSGTVFLTPDGRKKVKR